jgi:hypothetical protein
VRPGRTPPAASQTARRTAVQARLGLLAIQMHRGQQPLRWVDAQLSEPINPIGSLCGWSVRATSLFLAAAIRGHVITGETMPVSCRGPGTRHADF